MADGLTIATQVDNQTVTATATTDDCGAAGHAQVVKLAISTDGSATLIPADATNGIDVDVTRVSGTVTVDGSGVTQPVSAASLPLPTGAATSALQTSGNASLTTIAGAVAGTEMQVDVVTSALPAGAATSANQTTIIGHVDGIEGLLTTIDADTSALSAIDYATGADVASLGVVGGGLEATALRVTLASDSTGTLSVDDGGGILTVDGTVTANAGSGTFAVSAASLPLPTGASTLAEQQTQTTHLATVAGDTTSIQAAVEIMDDWDETDRCKVNPIVGQAGIAAGAGAVGVTVPRVTLASDDPAVVALQILDNAISGSEMQVDVVAALPAGTNYVGKVRLTDGTTDTDVRDLLNSNALNVAIVDGSGDQITSFGGGTEYTEDAAAAANPVGKATILVRADTPATIATTDGDNVAQRGTNYGAAYTQIVTSAGAFVDSFGGGTQYTEADTDASITGTAMMMEGAANALVPAQGTAADGLLVNLGGNNDVTVTGTVTVDGSGVTQPVSGTVTANLAAGTNNIGDVDVLTLPGTAAEAAALPSVFVVVAGDDGTDTQPLQLSAGGDLKVTLDSETVAIASIAAGDNNIGNVDIVTVPAPLSTTGGGTEATALRVTVASDSTGVLSVDDNGGSLTIDGTVSLAAGTNTNEVVGDVAHDAAAAGNPVLIAGVAQAHDDTAPPNRVSAESDATRLATDFDGALFVRPHGAQVWSYHLDTSTAQTDATVHAAPGAGLSLYVGTIVFSSGAATAINLFFEEGASKVLGPYYLEATAGRGMAVQFNPPKKITANTALTLTTSASIAHCVDVTGFTAQG